MKNIDVTFITSATTTKTKTKKRKLKFSHEITTIFHHYDVFFLV